MTARLIDVTPDAYHQLPGLSKSYATTLVQRSPLHAWQEHPAFGGGTKKSTKLMDRGAILHALVLGKGASFAPCPFDDWKTKAAQKTRDDYRAAGLIPVLSEDLHAYEVAAKAIRARLESTGRFLAGKSEVAIAWQEPSSVGPVDCRCMIDHLDVEQGLSYELKIKDDVNPEKIEASTERELYSIGAAAYIRAIAALYPDLAGKIEFRYVFAEPNPPYAIYAPEPDGLFLEAGEKHWLRAVDVWGRCLKTQFWPDYQEFKYISRPQWALRKDGYAYNE